MKRRWVIRRIDPARVGLPSPTWGVCDQARYVWERESAAGVRVVGCVCHHTWTKRVKAFEVVPDAPAQ